MFTVTTTGLQRQIASTFIGSLSVFCSGATYVWVTPLLTKFSDQNSTIYLTENEQSWMVSIIEVGDILGSIPMGYMADSCGRKPVLLAMAFIMFISWAFFLFSESILMLYIMRIIQGFGTGGVFTVLPMYLAEIPDPSIRGQLGNLMQIMWYVGILYVYCIGPLTSATTLTISCAIPPAVFCVAFLFFPETPYYYELRKKHEEAAKTWSWLKRPREPLPEKTLEGDCSSEEVGHWWDVFKERKCLKALVIVHVVMFANVVGVPAVLSYSSKTFSQTHSNAADSYTILMGVLTLIVSVFSSFTVDRIGRRPLLLISCLISSLLLAVAASYYFINRWMDITSYSDIAVWCIVLYPATMSLGPGSLCYILQAELFPSRHRASACGITTISVAIATLFGLKFYSDFAVGFSLDAVFTTLSLVGLFATAIIYFTVPETKGKTFEEIQDSL